jgi:rhamnosyl/mannosyltransferase
MRIVHIYKDYFPVLGGIENHVKLLAEAQAARGHDVTVIVTQLANRKSEIENMNGVRVVKSARQLNVQSAPISVQFATRVRNETRRADIAHLHAPYPIGEACNLWFGRAKKNVITWHSDIVRQKTLLRVYAPILRRVVANANRIICTSEPYKRTSPWLTDAQDKCVIVPYGIQLDRFAQLTEAQQAKQAAFRAELQARAGGGLVLLCVGQLRHYKSFDTLIRALPKLPNVAMAIAGTGPYEAPWKAVAEEVNVADRVAFLGQTSQGDLPALYHGSDVFVLPSNSRAEAFGIVNIEAMACGLPLVTTDVDSGTSWVNQDGITGFVVPPMSPDALVAAIDKLRDPALRTRMGVAGRARAHAEFTEDRMIAQVESVYSDVLRED